VWRTTTRHVLREVPVAGAERTTCEERAGSARCPGLSRLPPATTPRARDQQASSDREPAGAPRARRRARALTTSAVARRPRRARRGCARASRIGGRYAADVRTRAGCVAGRTARARRATDTRAGRATDARAGRAADARAHGATRTHGAARTTCARARVWASCTTDSGVWRRRSGEARRSVGGERQHRNATGERHVGGLVSGEVFRRCPAADGPAARQRWTVELFPPLEGERPVRKGRILDPADILLQRQGGGIEVASKAGISRPDVEMHLHSRSRVLHKSG